MVVGILIAVIAFCLFPVFYILGRRLLRKFKDNYTKNQKAVEDVLRAIDKELRDIHTHFDNDLAWREDLLGVMHRIKVDVPLPRADYSKPAEVPPKIEAFVTSLLYCRDKYAQTPVEKEALESIIKNIKATHSYGKRNSTSTTR